MKERPDTSLDWAGLLQLIGVLAPVLFIVAGVKMLRIESVSGDSVAEVFYHAFGWFSFALGALSVGLLTKR